MPVALGDFDLDVRLAEPEPLAYPDFASKPPPTSDAGPCTDSHHPTCGRACTGTSDYCTF